MLAESDVVTIASSANQSQRQTGRQASIQQGECSDRTFCPQPGPLPVDPEWPNGRGEKYSVGSLDLGENICIYELETWLVASTYFLARPSQRLF